jgi:hypothetical protein
MENQILALKKKCFSSFKMQFKIKVVDTLFNNNSAIITFFEASDDSYESIRAGNRVKIMNISPALGSNNDSHTLNLNMLKGSSLYNYSDNVLRPPQKYTE